MIDNVISGKTYWYSSFMVDMNPRILKRCYIDGPMEVVVKENPGNGNISLEDKSGNNLTYYATYDNLFSSKEEAIECFNNEIKNRIEALTMIYEATKGKLESLLI